MKKLKKHSAEKIAQTIELIKTNTVTEACKITGVPRSNLYWWLNKLGLGKPKRKKDFVIDEILKQNS